jgi:hypothetical protein
MSNQGVSPGRDAYPVAMARPRPWGRHRGAAGRPPSDGPDALSHRGTTLRGLSLLGVINVAWQYVAIPNSHLTAGTSER